VLFNLLRNGVEATQAKERGEIRVLGPEAAAMCLNDRAADRQSDTHSVGLRGDERLE
jgi:hypothetical protein